MAKKRPNGAGSIVLRKDGRWMGRVYVLTDSGFPERVTVYGGSYDEVDAELAKLKENHRQAIPKVKATSKFGDYLVYWLAEAVSKERSYGTYVNYESLTRNYIAPALGDKILQKLTMNDVRRFVYGKLPGRSKRLEGCEVSDRTRQLLLTVVSSALTKVFSYAPDSTAATEQTAREVLGGTALSQYEMLFAQVKQRAAKEKLTVTTRVVRAGVVRLSGDTAQLLVFLDQIIIRKDRPQGTSAAAQLSVTAKRSAGHWRIVDIHAR